MSAVVPLERTRKGWDIALSVFLLLLAAAAGFVGGVVGVVALAFSDSCVAVDCDVDAAVSAQFTAALFVVLAFAVGLIATIVALATRRRGWWIALLTVFVVLGVWVLGFVGFFAAVDG